MDNRKARVLTSSGVELATGTVDQFKDWVPITQSGVATHVQIEQNLPMELSMPSSLVTGHNVQIWFPHGA